MSRNELYAARIAKRAITIADVPKTRRNDTMALLSEGDKKRQEALLKEAINAAS